MHSPAAGMSQNNRPIALAVRGLAKRFDRPAVDALDLTVYGGEFYALVGPNGAGKTTTLRMVAGLLRPDAGSIAIDGIDALSRSGRRQADHRLAVGRADDLRQAHAVRISRIRRRALAHRRAKPAEARARELIGWLGLEPHAHERCEGFSRGMRQKVALAGALVHDPKLIILDEPLTGLDAGSARLVKNVLRERVAAGGTVIMTTHILEVAERMADRIGVIASGRLIAEGTLDELHRKTGQNRRQPGRYLPHAGRRAGRATGRGRVSRPDTLTWLAGHELRLGWRDWVALMTAGRRNRARTVAIALIVFAAFMHVFAYWIVAGYADANVASDTATLVGITGTLVLSWSLLLSQAMESVTRAFYARSDLDLILTSPVSARKVFAVRMGRIAAASVMIAVLLAAPFINVLAMLGGAAGLPPMAWSPPWARWRRRRRSRSPSRCSASSAPSARG